MSEPFDKWYETYLDTTGYLEGMRDAFNAGRARRLPQPVTQTIGTFDVFTGIWGKLKIMSSDEIGIIEIILPEPSPLRNGDKVRVIVEKVSE